MPRDPRPTDDLAARQAERSSIARSHKIYAAWIQTPAGQKMRADCEWWGERCRAGVENRAVWFEGLP